MLSINTFTNTYSGSTKGWLVLYPAGLGLLLQGLDAAAVGAQVRHQGLVLLQQSLWTKQQSQQTGAGLEEGLASNTGDTRGSFTQSLLDVFRQCFSTGGLRRCLRPPVEKPWFQDVP